MALLNALLMAALDSLADLSALVFCVNQLLLNLNIAVRIVGIQIIIQKDDRNPFLFQILDVLETLHGVTAKT